VRDGTIDTLATDHAPHADFEKEAPFAQAANGISGLDTALSLTWSLIEAEELGLADALRLWCERPAAIFRLASNGFQPGDPADFFLFHPGEPWTVSEASLKSKGKNTPCLGQELKGKVKMSCIQGSLAYTEEHEPELG
jgi:dihydroorotase